MALDWKDLGEVAFDPVLIGFIPYFGLYLFLKMGIYFIGNSRGVACIRRTNIVWVNWEFFCNLWDVWQINTVTENIINIEKLTTYFIWNTYSLDCFREAKAILA